MSDSNGTALSDLGITVAIEKLEIANALNSSLFVALLMGIYTVVYGGTMYIYFARGSSKRYLVPATVSALYLCNLAQFGLGWYVMKWQFVDNGENQDLLFLSLTTFPLQFEVTINVLFIISLVLGDALLIWRCFNVWNRSFLVISIPIFLVFAEAGELSTLLAETIGGAMTPASDVDSLVKYNRLGTAGLTIAAGITLITTSLIAYRIYTFSTEKGLSARRFSHVIDIVVQSGAVYTLSLVVFGVSGALINSATFWNPTVYGFYLWSQGFILYVAGISTTILVARVAMITGDTNPPTSVHLSGLQFQQRSINHSMSVAQVTVDIPGGNNARGSVYDGSDQVQISDLEKEVQRRA